MSNRELDLRIHIEVLGLPEWCDGYTKVGYAPVYADYTYCRFCSSDGLWDGVMARHQIKPNGYSTDIIAAWQIVEHLGNLNMDVHVSWKGAHREYANSAEVAIFKDFQTIGHGYGTAPEAICNAALMAVERLKAQETK